MLSAGGRCMAPSMAVSIVDQWLGPGYLICVPRVSCAQKITGVMILQAQNNPKFLKAGPLRVASSTTRPCHSSVV